MKKHIKIVSFILICSVVFSSCAQKIGDFTVISTKSHTLSIDKMKGKATLGYSMGFIGVGVSIKDAVDDALEKAGSGYDLLIEGTIKQMTYPFYAGFVVEGIAIRSEDLKMSMSEEEFKKWCEIHNIFDATTAVVED